MKYLVQKGVTGHVFVWQPNECSTLYLGVTKATKNFVYPSYPFDINKFTQPLQEHIKNAVGDLNVLASYRYFVYIGRSETWFFFTHEINCRPC